MGMVEHFQESAKLHWFLLAIIWQNVKTRHFWPSDHQNQLFFCSQYISIVKVDRPSIAVFVWFFFFETLFLFRQKWLCFYLHLKNACK